MNTAIDLLGFLSAAGIIVLSGSRLSRYGDMMADMLGWGKMFMGILLISAITSLPEMLSGVSAVVFIDAPDLAVADIVGSCAFNVLIISILDVFYDPKKPLTSVAQTGHVIAAAFGTIMLTLVAFAIIMPSIFGRVGWIGGFSFIFLILYAFAMRIVFLYERKQPKLVIPEMQFNMTLRQVILRFGLHALVVMAAATVLPYFGEHLAKASGLGQSFFGTLFIAASTSLPEIVVSVAAIRLGGIDMAIGNIFGSNIFNIGILAMNDILYKKGPIFFYTTPNHIIPVLGTIVITGIGMIGLVYKSGKKWKLALDSAAILGVYVGMMALLYFKKH
jgi:cation:H+ antiporter